MWYLPEGEGKKKKVGWGGKDTAHSLAGQDGSGAEAGASPAIWERQGSGGESQVGREGLARRSVGPAAPPRRAAVAPSQSFLRRQPGITRGGFGGRGGGAAPGSRQRRVGRGGGGEVSGARFAAGGGVLASEPVVRDRG